MTIREQINSIAEKRILILDGAMGSLIQELNLNENDFRGNLFTNHPAPLKGCNDILCLTKPEVISAIHNSYLEAGADIIETCSFNSTSITLSDYRLEHLSYEVSAAAAKIARGCADKFSVDGKPRFVAGSMGPTAKGASLYPDISNPSKRSIHWDELEAAYYENARGLLDGGADILLVETVFDTLNAKAALFAISRIMEERQIDIPVIISAAVSGEALPGRLLSGQTLEAFCISVMHINPLAVGLNCSFNAQKLLPFVREASLQVQKLSETVPCLFSVYPNAGLPNNSGKYEETPETMSADIETFFREGIVNIIGGCCGSTPAHIKAIAEKAAKYAPRKITCDVPGAANRHFISGLEPLYIDGDNIGIEKIANSDELKKLLADGEYEDAVDTARDLIEDGAEILCIETDNEEAVGKFLDYALMNPYVAKVPFLIKSSDMNVLEKGLKRIQGRSLAFATFAAELPAYAAELPVLAAKLPAYAAELPAEQRQKIERIRRYGAAAVTAMRPKDAADNCPGYILAGSFASHTI